MGAEFLEFDLGFKAVLGFMTTSTNSYRSSCHFLMPRMYLERRLSSMMNGIISWRTCLLVSIINVRGRRDAPGHFAYNPKCLLIVLFAFSRNYRTGCYSEIVLTPVTKTIMIASAIIIFGFAVRAPRSMVAGIWL